MAVKPRNGRLSVVFHDHLWCLRHIVLLLLLGAFGQRAHAQDWSGELRMSTPGTVWRVSHPSGGRSFGHDHHSPHHSFGIGGRAFGPERHGIIAEAAWLLDEDLDGIFDEDSSATSLFVAHVGYAHRRIIRRPNRSVLTVTTHASLTGGRETWIGHRDCWHCTPRSRRALRGNILIGARVGVDFEYHRGRFFWGFGFSYGFAVHLGDNDRVGAASHFVGFNAIPRIGFSFGPGDPVRAPTLRAPSARPRPIAETSQSRKWTRRPPMTSQRRWPSARQPRSRA